jgi:hypothetical protein
MGRMLVALSLLAAVTAPQAPATAPSLAVSVGVVRASDDSAANDSRLIREALATRGLGGNVVGLATEFTSQELLESIRGFLTPAQQWRDGLVILHISGPGALDEATKVPSVLTRDGRVTWPQILEAARVPAGVSLLLLPDTGYANTLFAYLPANAGAVAPDFSWQNTAQRRAVVPFVVRGEKMQAGIVSMALSRELLHATDLRGLADALSRYKASGSPSAIWAELERQTLLGRNAPLAGLPR